MPVPHVAARRARRGPDADQHDPGRHPAEDGRVRHLPHRLPALPRRRASTCGCWSRSSAWSASSTARCARWPRPTSRSSSPTRPSRTWASSMLGAAMMTDARRQRRAVHDGRPRHHQRDDVLHRRRGLRAGPPPRARPLRRTGDDHAGLHRLLDRRHASPTSACPGLCGFIGEVHGAARHVPGAPSRLDPDAAGRARDASAVDL